MDDDDKGGGRGSGSPADLSPEPASSTWTGLTAVPEVHHMLEQAIPRYRPTLADWRAAVDGLEAQGPPADAVVDHHARWDNTDWLEATWYGPADPEEES